MKFAIAALTLAGLMSAYAAPADKKAESTTTTDTSKPAKKKHSKKSKKEMADPTKTQK